METEGHGRRGAAGLSCTGGRSQDRAGDGESGGWTCGGWSGGARRPPSFHVSLILALLRKKLAELDAGAGDTRLVLSRDEIVEMLRVFLPESSNEARVVERIDTHLNRIVDLGFLRRMRAAPGAAAPGAQTTFEVRRILEAFVDAEWLAELDARLAAYRAELDGREEADRAQE